MVQLIERCQAGDGLAVELLLREHQPGVFRLAISILDDPAEADEATQETFLAALRAIESYRGEAAFRTWLYAIALNVCRERLRKCNTRQRLHQALQAVFRLVGPAPQPEEAAIHNETNTALWGAVNRLDEKHRLPLILRYYHEISTAEIAQMLNTSERTIYTRLATAHERLKALLKGKVELR